MALQQAVQQLEFQVGQAHRLVKPDGFKALGDQGDRPKAQDFAVLAGEGGTVTAAQQGLDPCDELLQFKGLGEVIISPGVEAGDFVFGAAKGGEHQDGNLCGAIVAAQALAEGEAIHPRQH